MPILPALADYVASLPPFDPLTPIQKRRAESATRPPAELVEPGPAVELVHDFDIPVCGGAIQARAYRPPGIRPKPIHLYMHGGGFVEGSLEETDSEARLRAVQADCVVVSINYRLAPEHPYPTAVEDCYTALAWCTKNARELGADPEALTVGGISAGANLAAVICLLARDRSGPTVRFQVLEVPATDLVGTHESHGTFGHGYGLTLDEIRQTRSWYLTTPDRGFEPHASPLRAPILAGLPPAYIATSEFDLLRDEGESYAFRMSSHGSEVTLKRWPGMIHGASALTALLPEARQWQSTCNRALRMALA